MVFKIINIGSSPVFLVCSILLQSKIGFFFSFIFKFIIFFIRNILALRFFTSNFFFNFSKRIISSYNFFLLDLFLIFFFLVSLKANFYKLSTTTYKFSQLITKLYNFFKIKIFENNYVILGFKYLWLMIRFWVFGAFLFVAATYYFMLIRSLPVTKILFQWVVVIMVLYWLMSGFVFFIKKYRFGKFTTAIQRFWRRSFMIFWLIESFLFLIFVYLTINANQEPVYMYDNLQIYKTHLFSWRMFLLKLIPVTILLILTYFSLLFMKWGIFSKSNLMMFTITLLLIYIVWLEFYQFFHVLNYYGNLVWLYDSEEHLWFLESDFKKTRIVNHYITICIIAKFWHLIFIFALWVFFILRGNELSRYRYPLLSANLQNFLMLYLLSWIGMYPWFKFVFRRYLENPYFWFYVNPRRTFFKMFFNDLKLVYLGFIEIFDNVKFTFYFKLSEFFYIYDASSVIEFYQFDKHIIRGRVLESLIKI